MSAWLVVPSRLPTLLLQSSSCVLWTKGLILQSALFLQTSLHHNTRVAPDGGPFGNENVSITVSLCLGAFWLWSIFIPLVAGGHQIWYRMDCSALYLVFYPAYWAIPHKNNLWLVVSPGVLSESIPFFQLISWNETALIPELPQFGLKRLASDLFFPIPCFVAVYKSAKRTRINL